jgi:DNA-binding MarR family transcriptional regulator
MNKIPYFVNRSVVFLPKKVFNIFEKEQRLDSLAFYIQTKKKFKNSKIFNYSLNRLNEITGLSIGTLSKHINALNRLGLIEISNKVLTFKNPKKLTQYANSKGKIKMSYFKVMSSYRTQKIFLKNFKSLCNLKKQERLINTTPNKLKSKRNLAQTAIKKRLRKGIKYSTLSNFRYSQIINKSSASVSRHKAMLESENVFIQNNKFKKTKFSIEELNHMRRTPFLDFEVRKYRLVDGVVCIQLSNEIKVCNY